MSRSVVLAIDQGTTNTKVVAVDDVGAVVARHATRVEVTFPHPGWVESDPAAIWSSVQRAVDRVVAAVGGARVVSVGVSNQRESVVAWDRVTGEPLGPVVSWQCTRGAPFCAGLPHPEADDLVRDLAGLALDPMFSASKMRWLLDHVDGARDRAADGRLAIGTVDSWLLWRLTGGEVFATDLTNASRTALCDIESGCWSGELCGLFGVPIGVLPDIRASADDFGVCRTTSLSGLGEVPVGALIGDSHAALVGHGAFAPGSVKASFGTGTSVMAPVADGHERPADLAMTIGWSARTDAGRRVVHAIEGNIYATGAALAWTANLLGLAGDVAALEELARDARDTVSLVPAFSGLGAPHWDPDARAAILGLTLGSGRAEVARSAFDAIAHQVADVLDAAAPALGGRVAAIHADGGAMRSTLLASVVADITGAVVRRSDEPDMSALGAAFLAGHSAGVWPTIEAIADLPRSSTTVEPVISEDRRSELRLRWADSVGRVRRHEAR